MTQIEGQADLFGVAYPDGLVILAGFAGDVAGELLAAIADIARQAPFRHMQTPGGHAMSAAMTNGGLGWTTDRRGYRYAPVDPLSGKAWPALPQSFHDLAGRAARAAGFADFTPDGCLINRYAVGARMGLHQDLDEGDMAAPIVSVSLGLPATFQFGGRKRSDPVMKIALQHGDVAVWGGPARLAYHGVLPVKAGLHPLAGDVRYNMTLRRVRVS